MSWLEHLEELKLIFENYCRLWKGVRDGCENQKKIHYYLNRHRHIDITSWFMAYGENDECEVLDGRLSEKGIRQRVCCQ